MDNDKLRALLGETGDKMEEATRAAFSNNEFLSATRSDQYKFIVSLAAGTVSRSLIRSFPNEIKSLQDKYLETINYLCCRAFDGSLDIQNLR
jgi:hypothetical protein